MCVCVCVSVLCALYLAYFIEIPHSQLRLVLQLAKIQVIWQLRCQHIKISLTVFGPVRNSSREMEKIPTGVEDEANDDDVLDVRARLNYT